ncbi:MAG: hypothetical protein OXN25_16580 [Candidatus Poribacteria bacterium]|nr:hypothetical protein [Candidatus Poribacteria bacterium]
MKGIATPVHSDNQIAPVFLILSYAISVLLLFSPGTGVWAKAPEIEKIAFTSTRDGNTEIYIMNPDGSAPMNVSQHAGSEDYDPAWSPSGKQILFISDRDGLFDLYLMEADGTNVRKVFKTKELRRDPTWSPDGKQIAYAQGEEPDQVIYIAAIDGTSIEKLTDGFMPSWSPDGSEIAFVVGGIQHTPLGIFNLQTRTQKRMLPKEVPWIVNPSWSPQGKKIAFSKIDGRFDPNGFLWWERSNIYVVNRDGTGLHQVIKDEESICTSPIWSPQGNELIYTDAVRQPGKHISVQLFKTDLNGGKPTQLTHEGNNSRADWFAPTGLNVSPSGYLLMTTWGKSKQSIKGD